MGIKRILIQDEEGLVHHLFEERIFHITVGKSRQWATDRLGVEEFDLVICDDIDILKKVKALHPQTVVVVMTPFPSVENAVEAMHLGAFDYLVKPISLDTWSKVLDRIESSLSAQATSLFPMHGKIERIIADSAFMKQLLNDVAKIAKSNASVFISGESGTGKEVIASAIHHQSHRASHPFIKVNCAAIPDTLIESEFFGHEKGSFTGAIDKRVGRFELAHRGTLLLDEISEIPPAIQAKLLRAVQEMEFERVGGTKPIKVDVRFISTSNRNMKEAIEQKMFREDLYYRLNVVPVLLPPLRERKDDIIALAEDFLVRLCEENHKKPKKLAPAAKALLLDYSFPGNVRELANIMERTVVMENGDEIRPEHLRLDTAAVELSLDDLEKKHILDALARHGENKTKAAKALGISLKTLRNKLKLYL
jgi:two-component system response regulator AtoC